MYQTPNDTIYLYVLLLLQPYLQNIDPSLVWYTYARQTDRLKSESLQSTYGYYVLLQVSNHIKLKSLAALSY
jgi:hypothetical protein